MAKAFDVIPHSDTWDIMDASKLTEYMRCPRKFFYRYILGWQSDYPVNDLVFGTAWHMAQEYILNNGYGIDAVAIAKYMFLHYYRSNFTEETDELFAPKTPANAFQALDQYVQTWREDLNRYKVLHTEVGGLVNISDEHTMAFKVDSILREGPHKVVSIDHKTSKYRMNDWGDHWTMSTQMLTYFHVLKCIYGADTDVQMLVRSTFFYQTKSRGFEGKYEQHVIDRSDQQMQAYQDRTITWLNYERLERDYLAAETTDTTVMNAYPQNDTACFAFNRKCPYFDYCDAWQNPLRRCETPPVGIKVAHWNPLDSPEITTHVNLTEEKDVEKFLETEKEN